MEFIKSNFINTTTMIAVTNNTQTANNLINRDEYYQYYTDGLNDDTMYASVTITFGSTLNISRIALLETNVKEFTVFYNGVTANSFLLVSQNTTASAFTGNADSNVYLKFATIAVSSVTIDMKKTITANQEKVLGEFVISDLIYSLGQIPNSSGFKPSSERKQIVHTLSDGGTRISNIRKKFNLPIKLDYVPQTMVTSLRSVYDMNSAFIFAAFGTSTGWVNPVIFDAVWIGAFKFYEYTDDAATSGFSGDIILKETPS